MIITDHMIISIICPHEISSLLASQMSGRFLNQSRRLRRKPYKGRYLLHPPFLLSWKWIFFKIFNGEWNSLELGDIPYLQLNHQEPEEEKNSSFSASIFMFHISPLAWLVTICDTWGDLASKEAADVLTTHVKAYGGPTVKGVFHLAGRLRDAWMERSGFVFWHRSTQGCLEHWGPDCRRDNKRPDFFSLVSAIG